jgi:hypothetical protein
MPRHASHLSHDHSTQSRSNATDKQVVQVASSSTHRRPIVGVRSGCTTALLKRGRASEDGRAKRSTERVARVVLDGRHFGDLVRKIEYVVWCLIVVDVV